MDEACFFQAEDGIRDGHVTGVQTCALPILIQEQGHVGLESRCEGVANTFPETEILYVDSADMPSVEADLTAKLQAGGEQDVMVTLGAPIATTALLAKETAGSDIEIATRSEEHTSELQSRGHLVCR